jgi:hypothetical protein
VPVCAHAKAAHSENIVACDKTRPMIPPQPEIQSPEIVQENLDERGKEAFVSNLTFFAVIFLPP